MLRPRNPEVGEGKESEELATPEAGGRRRGKEKVLAGSSNQARPQRDRRGGMREIQQLAIPRTETALCPYTQTGLCPYTQTAHSLHSGSPVPEAGGRETRRSAEFATPEPGWSPRGPSWSHLGISWAARGESRRASENSASSFVYSVRQPNLHTHGGEQPSPYTQEEIFWPRERGSQVNV